MSWWLVFAIFLYLIAAVLLIAEIFVPSGGVITICALAALAGGIAIFFKTSTAAGWIGVVIAVIMVPSVLIFAYRLFPKTSFGKSVVLAPPVRQKGDAIADTPTLKNLLGKTGIVTAPLRPVGICDFSGQRFECVAESGYIEKEKTVEVIKVQGTQLTVRLKQQA